MQKSSGFHENPVNARIDLVNLKLNVLLSRSEPQPILRWVVAGALLAICVFAAVVVVAQLLDHG